MKKIFFYLFIILSGMLFCLFSCTSTENLYDVIFEVVGNDESLPAGQIFCYGKKIENGITDEFLSDYLGLSGYEDFKDNIEELAFFSSTNDPYCEIAVMSLYRSSDAKDAQLFFERRIKDATRAINVSEREGFAKDGYVKNYGNVVALFMMPDNAKYEGKLKSAL